MARRIPRRLRHGKSLHPARLAGACGCPRRRNRGRRHPPHDCVASWPRNHILTFVLALLALGLFASVVLVRCAARLPSGSKPVHATRSSRCRRKPIASRPAAVGAADIGDLGRGAERAGNSRRHRYGRAAAASRTRACVRHLARAATSAAAWSRRWTRCARRPRLRHGADHARRASDGSRRPRHRRTRRAAAARRERHRAANCSILPRATTSC